jgi:hypothetical protein
MFLFYSDVSGASSIDFLSIKIPMQLVIILWWLSLTISNSWLINTYRDLRKKFENSVSGINIGENNHNIKKQILILLVCNIILFVFAHLLSIKWGEAPEGSTRLSSTKFVSKNTIKIITTLSGVAISSTLLYLNDKLSTNTKIITTQ